MLKKCNVETGFRGELCNRPIWDKSGSLCIFHSEKEKDPDEFQELFLEDFERQQRENREDVLIFTHFIFPDFKALREFEFSRQRADIDFHGSRFMGIADFRETGLECFKVDFSESTFFGPVDFSGAPDAPAVRYVDSARD